MKTASILICATLGFTQTAFAAEAGHREPPAQVGAPPSLLLASPGLYRSGNECAPDRPEAAWGPGGKFLGYACVRNPSNR